MSRTSRLESSASSSAPPNFAMPAAKIPIRLDARWIQKAEGDAVHSETTPVKTQEADAQQAHALIALEKKVVAEASHEADAELPAGTRLAGDADTSGRRNDRANSRPEASPDAERHHRASASGG